MAKSIVVLPKRVAQDFSHDKPWACISVVDPDSKHPLICLAKCLGIHRVKFWDVDDRESEQAFDSDHARAIWDFIVPLWDKVDLLMVHCIAGRSRSAGIAAAIGKVFYNDDEFFFRRFTPNSLVYSTMLKVANEMKLLK